MATQKPKSEFEREMIHLEAEIRRLEAEFNMFFAGRLPRPPWETRAKVAALVKRHDQSFIRNTADRFRFDSLQNRYAKFLELWERQMTNRELGRPTLGARRAPPPVAAPPADAAAGKAKDEKPKDEKHKDEKHKDEKKKSEKHKDEKHKEEKHKEEKHKEEKHKDEKPKEKVDDRVKQLYEQLAAAKKQVGEKPIEMDRLAALVKAQTEKFKSEGKEVAFKVSLKDGKVQLTAKAADDKKKD